MNNLQLTINNEQLTINNVQLAMSARNLTYRPAAQSAAAAPPSPDGGWRVVFPPAAGSHNPRRRETTRVAPFAHLHIGSFANLHIGSFANYSLKFSFSAKERDTETGLSYFGARYYSSDLSIWLSVDPMSGKYPSLSPYVYCADNPVKLVDPNGDTVRITGDGAEEVKQQLQNQTSEGFKLELADGILSFSGEAITDIDLMIAEAILSENITVNIMADNGNTFANGLHTEAGGGYMGNIYENGKVSTLQFVCPSMLADFDKSVGDREPGLTMVHELAESYLSGQMALWNKTSSPREGFDGSFYEEAHRAANKFALGGRKSFYLRFFSPGADYLYAKPSDSINRIDKDGNIDYFHKYVRIACERSEY